MSITTTLDLIPKAAANVDLNSFKITNLANGTLDNDAINLKQLLDALLTIYTKAQVDALILGLQEEIDQITTDGVTLAQLTTILLDYYTKTETNAFPISKWLAAEGTINMNLYRIRNLGDPLNDEDAVNKAYLRI